MSRREDIVNSVWADHYRLSNDAILIYIWSTTNPLCGMSGAYRCPRPWIAEGRVPDDGRLDAALAELEAAGLIYFQEDILWNPERAERIHSRTPQIAKSMAKDLIELKGTWVLPAFAARYSSEQVPWIAKGMAEGSGAERYREVIEALTEVGALESRGSENGLNSDGREPLETRRGRGRGRGQGTDDAGESEYVVREPDFDLDALDDIADQIGEPA